MSPRAARTDPRRTKIVGTIGPASGTKDTLTALVRAGLDAARLNFSHGTHDQHKQWAELVREVQEDVGRPLALIADLQGPKLRIGDLTQPVELKRGEDVVVAGGNEQSNGVLP
jgi:pyruvate kinase